MWKGFATLDRSIDRVGYWYGGYVMLTAALSGLAKGSTWFGGINWADAIFIGIVAAALLALVLSVCLVAIRFYRPIAIQTVPIAATATVGELQPAGRITREEFNEARQGTGSVLRAFDDRISATSRDSAEIKQRLGVIEQLLTAPPQGLLGTPGQFNNRFELFDAKIREEGELRNARVDDIGEKLDNIRTELSENISRLQINSNQFQERIVDLMQAKQALDRLLSLERAIKRNAEKLSRFKSLPVGEQDYTKWRREFHDWQRSVNHFDTVARKYHRSQDVMVSTLPHEYKGDWTFTVKDFVSEDAHHDFKEFCLINRNFHQSYEILIADTRSSALI